MSGKIPEIFYGRWIVNGEKVEFLDDHEGNSEFTVSEEGVSYQNKVYGISTQVGNELMFHCGIANCATIWVWNRKYGPNRAWVYFIQSAPKKTDDNIREQNPESEPDSMNKEVEGEMGYTHRDMKKVL